VVQEFGRILWLVAGAALGAAAALVFLSGSKPVLAANDRFEDFVMCTGPVGVNSKGQTDGVWLLDYRSGKLLGTVIDRNIGKIVGWTEVDLVMEFGVQPKQPVHFLMTTGNIAQGQAALYVAETSSGKFGVYSMGPPANGKQGVTIQRHDLVMYRKVPPGD
jgi:hypothetical protein